MAAKTRISSGLYHRKATATEIIDQHVKISEFVGKATNPIDPVVFTAQSPPSLVLQQRSNCDHWLQFDRIFQDNEKMGHHGYKKHLRRFQDSRKPIVEILDEPPKV